MKDSKQKSIAKGTIHFIHERGPCKLESLKAEVLAMEGVSSVQANHVSHVLSIEYDPKKVTLDQIRKKIAI